MNTAFDYTVDRIITHFKHDYTRPERDTVITRAYVCGDNQFTLQIDKRLQGESESKGIKLWTGVEYRIRENNTEDQGPTFAKLSLRNCTIEQLSRLESILFFQNVHSRLRIDHVIHDEPLVSYTNHQVLNNVTMTDGRHFDRIEEWGDIKTICKKVGSMTSGLIYEAGSFDSLAKLYTEDFCKWYDISRTVRFLSKGLHRTRAFKSAINAILDKYQEFDASDLRDRPLIHTVDYGGIPITVTVDKAMQGLFESLKIELYKGCQYKIGEGENRKCFLYSKISVPHATLSQLKYLEKQLLKRKIKTGLHLPCLILLFRQNISFTYPGYYSLDWLDRCDEYKQYFAKDLLVAPRFRQENFSEMQRYYRTTSEYCLEKMRLRLDRVNTILQDFKVPKTVEFGPWRFSGVFDMEEENREGRGYESS